MGLQLNDSDDSDEQVYCIHRRLKASIKGRLRTGRIARGRFSARHPRCMRLRPAQEPSTEFVVLTTEAARPNKAETVELYLLKKQVRSSFPFDNSRRTSGIGCFKSSRVRGLCIRGDGRASTRLSLFSPTLVARPMFLDEHLSLSLDGCPQHSLGRRGFHRLLRWTSRHVVSFGSCPASVLHTWLTSCRRHTALPEIHFPCCG